MNLGSPDNDIIHIYIFSQRHKPPTTEQGDVELYEGGEGRTTDQHNRQRVRDDTVRNESTLL